MPHDEDPTIPRPPSTALGKRNGKPITMRRARRLAIANGTHVPQGQNRRDKKAPSPTDEQIAKMVTYRRAGNYLETCSSVAGVQRHTVRTWMERGNEKHANKKWPQEARLVREMETAWEQAVAAGLATIAGAARPKMIETTTTIVDAEGGTKTKVVRTEDRGAWQAEAWRLERMDPARFALKVRVTVEGELEAIFDALEAQLTPEEFARVLDIVSAIEAQ